MNEELCRQLDEYLLDELPDEQRECFEQHLRECGTCRSISEQQAIVNERVKSASLAAAVPARLTPQARRRIERDRRRRVTLIALGAVSAAGILFSIWFLTGENGSQTDPRLRRTITEERPAPEPDVPSQDDSPRQTIASHEPESEVQISFSDNVLAVPVESGDPTITLIQVYPVVQTLTETQ